MGAMPLFVIRVVVIVSEVVAVKSNYVDLKCRLAFRATDWLTLFARGENLLNQSYQTMLGFPEPGITFLGGISISL